MNELRALSLVVCSMIGLAACAQGTEVEASFTPGTGSAGEGGNAGYGGAGGDTAGTTTTGDGSTTSGAGGMGAGGDASTSSSSSSSSSGTGGAGCDYGATNDCPASEILSTIDGDQNSDTRTVKGTTSKWFKVLVNEAVSSVFNDPISYTATLATPPGMDFDLFEYDGTTTTPSCAGNPKHAIGNPELVSETWSDSNGSDDKWLTLEVRYISGDMCPSDPWTLTVKGHTTP
jgi:hypothetical protein